MLSTRQCFATLISAAILVMAAYGATTRKTRAQTPEPEQSIAGELIGAPVFTSDGSQVGEVSSVSANAEGDVNEIRMTAAARMGPGQRVVTLPPGTYLMLRGALMIDLTAEQVDGLPSTSAMRAPLTTDPDRPTTDS